MSQKISLLLLCGPPPQSSLEDLLYITTEAYLRDESERFLVRCDLPVYDVPAPAFLDPRNLISRDYSLQFPTD